MDELWLAEIVDVMRRVGNDLQTCEVKEAAGGLPKDLLKTLSAFSNGSGGTVILGLSERRGFAPAEGFDARAISDALAQAFEKLTPPVRGMIETLPFEGALVVCARIPEMHPRDKPCYITASNRYEGSFVRGADGDRHLTSYEVDRLMEEHRQPLYDSETVEDATMDDLDPEMLDGYVKREKALHPRILGSKSDIDVLLDRHVINRDGDTLRPTVAGIMAMGEFPQKFFPRLNITFTAFPGIDKTSASSEGKRYLDSQNIIGPIPVMMEDTLAAVSRNMRTGAVVEGTFRQDIPDYPPVAVREAVANALMHRDYSPESRGSQVQVNMYADRLEILNPGGLYGDVTIDTLGVSGVSSSRNQFLSNILESTPYADGGFVVENRGTGYQEIEEQLQRAQMMPPRPRNSTTTFSLTFDKRRVLPSEISGTSGDIDEAIVGYLREHTSASAAELAEASGRARSTIAVHVKALIGEGKVEPIEPMRSPKQRYRLRRD